MKPKNKKDEATEIGEPTNGAADTVRASMPYTANVTIEGTADFLFRRWNAEAIEAKACAAKGSKAKKTDDLESMVYRDDKGRLCIPGEYVRQSILEAAKYKQDPRSPRKSAAELFTAAVLNLTPLACVGKSKWDYEDRRRVMVQRNGVTRTRPAMRAGWRCSVQLMVQLPEYISPQLLQQVLNDAGRLVGIGDFRPTFGRFVVKSFDVGFE